jgi:hypothetical protein
MKSSSMPFKSSGMIQHSPVSTNNYRSSVKTKQKGQSTNILNLTSGGGVQNLVNVNSNNNMTRHPAMNGYTHNGPICFRLTNV